jgi:5S rRNA maturation endonuclease (ribonuclease M5)
MRDLAALKEALAKRAADFCFYLFPDGNVRYGKFHIGNLQGDAGKSLVITVEGDRAGMWKDFATGDGGSNLLELLFRKLVGEFGDACKKAEDWLGTAYFEPPSGTTAKTRATGRKSNKVNCCDVFSGTGENCRMLARLYGLDKESLHMASTDEILYFFYKSPNGLCWSVIDPGKHVRQDRRLDGRPFILKGGATAKMRTVGNPSWPVGNGPGKMNVILCEGSSDLLAAYQLVHVENLQNIFAPTAMLGASNSIHPNALPQFAYKNVLIFPDYDEAGITAAKRWQAQLKNYANCIKIFDFGGLTKLDGKPIKDLRDFLTVDNKTGDADDSILTPLESFLKRIPLTRPSFRWDYHRKAQYIPNQTNPLDQFNSERTLSCQ